MVTQYRNIKELIEECSRKGVYARQLPESDIVICSISGEHYKPDCKHIEKEMIEVSVKDFPVVSKKYKRNFNISEFCDNL